MLPPPEERKDVHSAIGAARAKAERTKIYLQAQEIFHREAPWAPLVHSTIVRCYSKKLHDVPLRPNGLNSFQMVSKEK